MKFFIFFFLLFISSVSFSMEIEICVGAGCPAPIQCEYNPENGFTVCLPMKSDGTVSNTNPTQVCDVNGCTNVYPDAVAGIWNPKTFSCSNYVSPKVSASGDIICPAVPSIAVPTSKSDPNPSKGDEGCDPSKDEDSGCASQETAVKTNDLISESNSKLGSIASSNATNTGLLSGILVTLQGIASQGSVGAGSSDSIFTNDESVQNIYVSSSFGMCPSPESFTVLNNNYELSYQFLCDMAQSMRGFVVALGALSAVTLVVTAL
jgi:hypothetical protein